MLLDWATSWKLRLLAARKGRRVRRGWGCRLFQSQDGSDFGSWKLKRELLRCFWYSFTFYNVDSREVEMCMRSIWDHLARLTLPCFGHKLQKIWSSAVLMLKECFWGTVRPCNRIPVSFVGCLGGFWCQVVPSKGWWWSSGAQLCGPGRVWNYFDTWSSEWGVYI